MPPNVAINWFGPNQPKMTLEFIAQLPEDRLRHLVATMTFSDTDKCQDGLTAVLDHCDTIQLIGAQRAWDMMAERRAEMAGRPLDIHEEVQADMSEETLQEAATQALVRMRATALHARLLPIAAQILSGIAAARNSSPTDQDAATACKLAIAYSQADAMLAARAAQPTPEVIYLREVNAALVEEVRQFLQIIEGQMFEYSEAVKAMRAVLPATDPRGEVIMQQAKPQVMVRGPACFGSDGERLPDTLQDTGQLIAPHLVERLHFYALNQLTEMGFDVSGWTFETYTVEGDLPELERHYVAEFRNRMGGAIGLVGIVFVRGRPFHDGGICIDYEPLG